jgi:superfamily II DNA or RNA helicase
MGDSAPRLDPRRMFTRPDVWRAWELQGRTCNLCRRAIPFDLMHGDHIIAWSAGGPTTIDNLQALCGSCNLRKGAGSLDVIAARFDPAKLRPGMGELRKWQLRALPIVMAAIREEPVLVEACPGAGKTRFGLEIAFRLAEAGEISRVLVVVPTVGIADGWWTAAGRSVRHTPTLPLHGLREWRAVDPIGEGWLGAITTYQSLFAAPEMYLAHATDPGHRTLVIFDEVHHAGADASWGEAAQFAFARAAKAILSLSGTPFRTGRDPIVFVPSRNGAADPHYRYSYDDAIRDKACRPVQFVEVRGATTFRTPSGELQTITFDDRDLTDAGERLRLRAALEWIEDRSIADKMLRDANRYLISLRAQGDTDAAGLVVCVDCAHAARVTGHLEMIIGRRPVMACSSMQDGNDPAPANAIRQFINSHDPWLVAVNMVSEGIDIRRLRVVVYLTNRLTLLSFRQIVGRVVRTDPANVDDHGRVYIPADGRLIDMARQVTDEPDLLPPPIVIFTDDEQAIRLWRSDTETGGEGGFEIVETVGEQGQVFDTAGRGAGSELIACARRFIEIHGLTGTDPESLAIAASETPALRDELLALRDA